MLKKIGNYFVIPLAIIVTLYVALKPEASLNYDDYSTKGLKLDYNISKDVAVLADPSNENSTFYKSTDQESSPVIFPYLGRSYNGFKEAVAFKESRGNYFTVNTLGYLGKYQFGAETLKLIGIYNPKQFLYNPELQEKAFLANAERNKWILR